ncbi:MAG: sodium:proton antiporter [Solimonas sp.]
MSLFQIVGLLLVAVALCGYLNTRFFRLPDVIGITVIGMMMSVALTLTGTFYPPLTDWTRHLVGGIDFTEVVFHGLLGLLLFAGSLHVNLSELRGQAGVVIVLATLGVVLSTVVVGGVLHLATLFLAEPLPLIWCLVFGALISPTDPIAVLGILKKAGAPRALEIKIAGESLFNDGIGIVTFVTLLGVAAGGHDVSVDEVGKLLVEEVAGGLLVGLAIGAAGFYLLYTIESYAVETLITLAMAVGGYALAEALHASAPIAVVVAGLVVGNHGRQYAMEEQTREHLFTFWDLTDELLNLVLFGLIGLEVIALSVSMQTLLPGLLCIPIVLLARFVSVGVPIMLIRRFRPFTPHTVRVLTWGGLRGAVSVALALSLPEFAGRDIVLASTYIVVVFSILVQGLTMGRLIRRLNASADAGP